MNLQAPVSTLMTTDLVVVNSDDKVRIVKDVMDVNGIHHVPVVRSDKLVGLISKTDLLHFLKGMSSDSYEEFMNDVRLKNYTAEEIMTEDLECLKPDDELRRALELFQKNRFHAIPVVKGDDTLVGILTTFDIINMVLGKKVDV